MDERDALLALPGAEDALESAVEKLSQAIDAEMRRFPLVLMSVEDRVVAEAGRADLFTHAVARDPHRQVMFVDKAAYAWLNRTAEEIAALERVCTPAGLRSLFPGLRG